MNFCVAYCETIKLRKCSFQKTAGLQFVFEKVNVRKTVPAAHHLLLIDRRTCLSADTRPEVTSQSTDVADTSRPGCSTIQGVLRCSRISVIFIYTSGRFKPIWAILLLFEQEDLQLYAYQVYSQHPFYFYVI